MPAMDWYPLPSTWVNPLTGTIQLPTPTPTPSRTATFLPSHDADFSLANTATKTAIAPVSAFAEESSEAPQHTGKVAAEESNALTRTHTVALPPRPPPPSPQQQQQQQQQQQSLLLLSSIASHSRTRAESESESGSARGFSEAAEREKMNQKGERQRSNPSADEEQQHKHKGSDKGNGDVDNNDAADDDDDNDSSVPYLSTSKPVNSFIAFSMCQRQQIHRGNPFLPNIEISRILGDLWKNMPPHARAQYQRLAAVHNRRLRGGQGQNPGQAHPQRQTLASAVETLSEGRDAHDKKRVRREEPPKSE